MGLAHASGTPTAPSTGGTYPSSVIDASAATGSGWQPEAATYGETTDTDVPVTMRDGTVLSVDVTYPTTNGAKATGPFPVIMTMTPYGKESGGALGGPVSYLVDRGYIDVTADVRGTGDSGGTWGLFDPVQATDGVDLVAWAAKLPSSNGKVGLYGASYLGIDQLFTAGAESPGSPLKAIFPVVAATDVYKDTAFMGGLLDSEFDLIYLGLTGGLNTANPLLTALTDPSSASSLTPTEISHLEGLESYHAASTANIESNGDEAFRGTYWQQRSPEAVLPKIVSNGIPAYLVGGEYDLFQRGEVLNYGRLQNLYAGRSIDAPITSSTPTTGRYQLLDGPWTHVVAASTDFNLLELRWFDTWLKGEQTGMATTPTPVHSYDPGTGAWVNRTSYDAGTPVRLYFGPGTGGTPLVQNKGTLGTAKPTTSGGSDTELFTNATNAPCSRSLDQWGAGVVQTAQIAGGLGNLPCVQDDRASQVGPSVLTYTTGAFTKPATITGSSGVTVYATSTTKDTELVATLDDVAPDGTSVPISEGALLGSYRAIDPAASVKASDGQWIRPDHAYTSASQQAVVPGQLTRYDFEIFPTYTTIKAGHALRLTLATADPGHLTANAVQLTSLVGGSYDIAHDAAAPSALELTLSSGSAASVPAVQAPDVSPPAVAAAAGGDLAFTGLGGLVPIAALVLIGLGAGTWRLRRR
jgi:hypothetical protein